MKEKKILVGMIVCLLVGMFLPLKTVSAIPESSESQTSQLLPIPQKESNDSQNNFSCGTLKILENFRENWLQSETTMKSTTSFYSSRPTDPGGPCWVIGDKQHLLPQIYNTTHFIIHWTNGSDGCSDPLDVVPLNDTNANGVPDYIENCAGFFEDSWDFEVTLRGFPSPPTDEIVPNDNRSRNPDATYDIFVYYTPGTYLAYAYFEQYPESPSFSYIGIRNNLEPLETMQAIAAHEFFHAIQFVYDCTEESWWMEASAVYMEDEVFPNSNFNYKYLPDWFLFSDTFGLTNIDIYGTHEYGSFIWAKRMSEDFGDEIIKEIWTEMNQTDGTNGLEAIENTLLSKNSTLLAEFSKFITANFFLEDCYEDGTEYREFLKDTPASNGALVNGVWTEYEYDASIAPDCLEINSSNVNWDAWMDKWAADYITLRLDSAKSKYRVTFDGLNLTANYLVKLATKKEGLISETMFTLDSQKDGCLDLSYDTFDNVTLIIANAGNTNTSDPCWRVTIEVVSPVYDVAITNVESPTYIAFTEQTINITVTVKNNGNKRYESFNVSTWWGDLLLATKSVTSLAPRNQEILEVEWTIPTGINGSKIIWANASIVDGETNLDNNRFENGMPLTIRIPAHNLTIRDITIQKNLIGQGLGINITVTLSNEGDFTETINVTLHLNGTMIDRSSYQITPGAEVEIDFPVFITSEIGLYENCTLEIQANWTLGGTSITDWIIVTIPGDINADKVVDIFDLVTVANSYGSSPEDPKWNSNADINGDGIIDIFDLVMVAEHYGEKDP